MADRRRKPDRQAATTDSLGTDSACCTLGELFDWCEALATEASASLSALLRATGGAGA